MKIQPLTRCNRKGEPYQRSASVTAQIETALKLPADLMVKRAKKSDSKSTDYLQEECLVYLIREYARQGHDHAVEELSEILLERSVRIIRGNLKSLGRDAANNAYHDVVNELFSLILNLDSNQADFFQVRYWLALKRLTITIFNNYRNRARRGRQVLPLSALDDPDLHVEDREVTPVFWDNVLDPPAPPSIEEQVLARGFAEEVLNILEEPYRTAVILRYLEDWQIESKDPLEPTISRHFKVTGRTIRNWLTTAEKQIMQWRGKNDEAQ